MPWWLWLIIIVIGLFALLLGRQWVSMKWEEKHRKVYKRDFPMQKPPLRVQYANEVGVSGDVQVEPTNRLIAHDLAVAYTATSFHDGQKPTTDAFLACYESAYDYFLRRL